MKKANMNVFLYSSGSAQPSGVTKLVIPAIFSSIRIDPKVMKTEVRPSYTQGIIIDNAVG